jgi:hypothetical protein
MVLVGTSSIGSTTIGGSLIGGSLMGGSCTMGSDDELPPPQAANETARNADSTILFSDVLMFMLTLACVHPVLVQCF